jgi:DNA-binding CsgD family transcriptional regulator
VELLIGRAGGEELTLIPAGWRAYGLELLTRCQVALDRASEAEQAAATAESVAALTGLPLASAWAYRATAAVALHAGNAECAVERALASAERAEEVGAPIESGRAAQGFETCGALRYRERAERELGKLGHRPHRRTRAGTADGNGIERLTEREIQVARLVVDRKTNPEIAADLFLSQKTVETHLRNIFRKVGVTTRVELARAVIRDDRVARAPTQG